MKSLEDYLYYEEKNPDLKIYLGDCLEILPLLPKVDLVVTDPSYGVGVDYGESFEDTKEYLELKVVPIMHKCIENYCRVVFTPGNKYAWLYPKPNDVGVWFNPAGTGFGSWGFNLAHLILYYGKDPFPNKMPSSLTGVFDRNGQGHGHPCPKPLRFIKWIINRSSINDETILDPFLGSGTTLVACKELNRNGIGIEISEKYCEIAKKRLQNTCKNLFGSANGAEESSRTSPKQSDMGLFAE